jgi:hypothetical protein
MWMLAAGAALASIPVAFRDGDTVSIDGPVTFGLVGGYAWAGPETADDLRSAELAFLVLAGDAVPRGSRRAYHALLERIGTVPVVPLPGAGESRSDGALRRFSSTFSGLGVAGLGPSVPWRSFDLRTDGVSWRFLVLDADRDRRGVPFEDELSWVPKVVAEGDAPLILLLNRPVRSLSASWPPDASEGAVQLHELVRRHTGPTRIALVAAGGAPTPEFVLPGGAWGEGWLGVGRADGPPDTLVRADATTQLEPGLDEALERWFVAEGAARPTVADDYRPDVWPVTGWWRVTLDGPLLTAALRMCRPSRGGCADVYTVSWTRDDGWRYPKTPVAPTDGVSRPE